MSPKTMGLSDELHAYVVAHGSQPDALTTDLIAETRAALPDQATMQVAPEQAALLTLLTRLVGARRAVEVGTFTGLSSLAISRGLAKDGQLLCFDVSERYTSIARRYWQRAGVDHLIELTLGPAAESLRQLPPTADIDLAFIDADKSNYPVYWEELVTRVRSGGLVIVDNTLWSGRVLDPQSADDRAIADFNDLVNADDRVDAVLLPIADGVTVARRR